MKVTAVETLRPALQANLCFVRLHTDTGLSGLGEAFYGSAALETYLHETAAPLLLDLDDPYPEPVARMLTPYVGYQGGGVEQRGNGAVDLALWDLLGQQTGQPLATLLGGPVRTSTRLYNTCAGTRYVSASTRQHSGNWGLPAADEHCDYEDLQAFLTRPGKLARDLWDDGIRAMKIWPFDQAAEATGGTDAAERDLVPGLAIVEAIREEVGLDMHGLWTRPAAARIAHALAPYHPYWIEDPLRGDAVDALAGLHAEVDVPIAAGETCAGRRGFLPLLQRTAADVLTLDIGWTGGLTEARKIATLADAYAVPIAPHDCTGPVALAAGVHLVCSQPNGLIQETARAFLRTWYTTLAEGLPEVDGDSIRLPAAPGHGVRLRDGLERDDTVTCRVTSP
jgi:L-alanine-DL-glutamate epimerase-like enolase superfamily enzyme